MQQSLLPVAVQLSDHVPEIAPTIVTSTTTSPSAVTTSSKNTRNQRSLTHSKHPLLPLDPSTSHSRQRKFVIEDVGKDGNCYFRCLSKWFKGDESHHVEYRKDIVDKITRDRGDYEIFLQDSVEEHLQGMSLHNGCTASYATDVEIYATSELYNIDVFVRIPESGNLDWNRYSFKEGKINDECDHRRGYLAIHNERDHYMLVRCSERPCNCTGEDLQEGLGNFQIRESSTGRAGMQLCLNETKLGQSSKVPEPSVTDMEPLICPPKYKQLELVAQVADNEKENRVTAGTPNLSIVHSIGDLLKEIREQRQEDNIAQTIETSAEQPITWLPKETAEHGRSPSDDSHYCYTCQ